MSSTSPCPPTRTYWSPPHCPPDDYPLAPTSHPTTSTIGGPVEFPPPGPDGARPPCDFQEFVWDVVNAVSRINSALFAYKKGVALGLPPDVARLTYNKALLNYRNLRSKWEEADHPSTWIQASVSADGYVTDVVVRSRAFSIHTPGQSESHNSTNPPRKSP